MALIVRGYRSPGVAAADSRRSRSTAALMSARWVTAGGKLPRCCAWGRAPQPGDWRRRACGTPSRACGFRTASRQHTWRSRWATSPSRWPSTSTGTSSPGPTARRSTVDDATRRNPRNEDW